MIPGGEAKGETISLCLLSLSAATVNRPTHTDTLNHAAAAIGEVV